MDINAAIDKLGLNANEYTLSQATPPHEIVEWRGSDPQPTNEELEQAWQECLVDQQAAADKETADAAARTAAIAHAKSLGFTDEMIAVMYPNLGAPNE